MSEETPTTMEFYRVLWWTKPFKMAESADYTDRDAAEKRYAQLQDRTDIESGALDFITRLSSFVR